MTAAIIVAAGSSRRMGFDKLVADLAGTPVAARTLAAFEACADITDIVVVTSPGRVEQLRDLAQRSAPTKLRSLTPGGAQRHDSVWNGIQQLPQGCELVAVHDAARPLISPAQIARCIDAAREHGAAASAHPISDTLKRADPTTLRVTGSVDRTDLWAMETPQVFAAALLREAYQNVRAHGHAVTDEVSALELLGHPVQLVPNQSPNPKITFPGDIELTTRLLQPEQP